jgi:transcriptional regulator with GAF, ATPase, and Fis domain
MRQSTCIRVIIWLNMGESLNTGDWIKLISDVATAAVSSSTPQSLTHKVGEALSRHLPMTSLELGWSGDSWQPAFVTIFTTRSAVRTVERDVRSILRLAQTDEIRSDANASGGLTIVIPLIDHSGRGYAQISLPTVATLGPLTQVLETLGRLLTVAQSHCRTIERIARQSSTAHHERRELRDELLKLTDPDRIVARSQAMRDVIEKASLVARHDSVVLIRGESGTGKELLARRIHNLSRRAKQPFVAVNCGALPESLIESELFGHERGAFTGATARYRGRFERAHNGTIFLDEIAELSLSAQVKLLRILQEGELERLGGESAIRVNVRVLAATHRPLETLIEQGLFREDLYYRINVFPIMIPSLRERREDIPFLVRTLLTEISKRLDCPVPMLSSRAMARLLEYRWPGNVRELENTLERALIVSEGRDLQFPELTTKATSVTTPTNNQAETFNDSARRAIQRALDTCQGRIYGKDGAAARLGLAPSTLQGKMRKLHMKVVKNVRM